jgi:hypothetical protein
MYHYPNQRHKNNLDEILHDDNVNVVDGQDVNYALQWYLFVHLSLRVDWSYLMGRKQN